MKLQSIVSVRAVVLLNPQVRELWERQQRLCPRDRGRAVEGTGGRQQSPEWIGNRRRKQSISGRVRCWIGSEERSRNEIEVTTNRHVITPSRYKVGFDHKMSGQLSLDSSDHSRELGILAIHRKSG